MEIAKQKKERDTKERKNSKLCHHNETSNGSLSGLQGTSIYMTGQ